MTKSSPLFLLPIVLVVCIAAPSNLQADPVELVLVLDASGSLGQDGWDTTEAAVDAIFSTILDPTELNGDLSVSIIQFSTGATVVHHLAPLDDQADVTALTTTIANMDWTSGHTWTKTAIETAMNEFNQHGSDPARRIISLFTDGPPWTTSKYGGPESQDPTGLKPDLDAMGVEVYITLTGDIGQNDLETKLLPLVDDPNTDLFNVTSFDGTHYQEIFGYAALPEPATMSILAVGGTVMIAKRKRKES
ncbi:MAG: VWA domain-containing protein [bacterium]|nr:VWA domain-containing protein [bacterium]